jgi:hypothetical protein
MAELVARYNNLPLGSVDASVIAAAERRDVAEIASLDHAISASSAPTTRRLSICSRERHEPAR